MTSEKTFVIVGAGLAGAKAATVAQPGIGVRATTRFPTQPAP